MEYTLLTKIKVRTYDSILSELSEHWNGVKRKLFVSCGIQGNKLTKLKSKTCANEGITSRQFNSIRFDLEGLLKAQLEIKNKAIARSKRRIDKLKREIKSLEKALDSSKKKTQLRAKVGEKKKLLRKIHQKKRKLNALTNQTEKFKEQLKRPSVCFGSKKLFKEQFYLKENRLTSHDEWKEKWDDKRSSSFFIVGCGTETFGNQSCQFLPGRLKRRLTNRMDEKLGYKHIEIPIQFAYEEK
jgi:hypothetical protein